ncbi:MAG: sialidase family protein [Promethearchaeota archaeon]
MMEGSFEKSTVFIAGTRSNYCYRIPALVRTAKGTLIAFCEARQRSCSDWAHSSIMARRCLDPVNNLQGWDEPFIVKESERVVEPRSWAEMVLAGQYADERGLDQDADDFIPVIDVCTNNPAPIVDQDGNTLHLIYCEHYDRAYYTKSTDDGITWSKSRDITPVLEGFRDEYDWTVIASGPGQGLQLSRGPHAGRLIVPFWFASNKDDPSAHHPSEVGIVYSDDSGKTWERGDFVPFTILKPNESKVVQLVDDSVLIYSRSMQPKAVDNPRFTRAWSISRDGAHDWSEYSFETTIPEPICMGSMVRLSWPSGDRKSMILYTLPNPPAIGGPHASTRVNLTAWLSDDEGKTWPIFKTIEAGSAAYSDLAVDPENGWIYCLYENGSIPGKSGAYNGISVVKFNVEWLTDGITGF